MADRKMRAVIQYRYGQPADVLRLGEIDRPVPADDEVLVRVHAASVHADVWHVVTGRPYVLRLMGAGLTRPTNPVPGTDLSGVVASAGKRVTRFRPGDAVFGETHTRHQWLNGGAFAEYAAVPEATLVRLPEGVSFEQAAAVPTSGYIALHNLGLGGPIVPGRRVLINGAGGAVGTIALQVAKARGAHVTGVDHAEKLEMLRALGTDEVVDYTSEDVTRREERYDLILDVASNLSLRACKPILSPAGVYVLIGHDHYGAASGRVVGGVPRSVGLMVMSRFVRGLPEEDLTMPSKREVMDTLAELLESEALTPIVDRTFPLEAATEALRYLEQGHARGKILIVPTDD